MSQDPFMRIHWFEREGTLFLYADPQPQPAPGVYLGALEMSSEDLDLLEEMVAEVKRDASGRSGGKAGRGAGISARLRARLPA